jgi:hypothetical protein
MIKFFRNIRRNLLSENPSDQTSQAGKFSKYLIYTIGEIILVVIGILIALAINNNNQNRAVKEKEQVYLNGLRAEFQASKFKLIELIKVNKRNYNGAKQITGYISNKDEPPTEVQFSELLFNTFSSDVYFNPNNSLLNEMINSGSLKDISNTDLRVLLTDWISILEDISKQEKELASQREKVLDIFRTDENSIRTVFDLTGISKTLDLPKGRKADSNLALLNSKAFENNILMFVLTAYATETAHYNPLMDNLNSILELINTEIKS